MFSCRYWKETWSYDRPMVEVLESVGGTGDMQTDIVTALIYSGINIEKKQFPDESG